MGINLNALKALSVAAGQMQPAGKSIITLGHQEMHVDLMQYTRCFGNDPAMKQVQASALRRGVFADDLFLQMGFAKADSMDYSDFEGAAVVHDLNKPIDPAHVGTYDIVMDGGTLEHVFNFPVAIDSCMKLVRAGGLFLMVTPANNLFGHGFYQFSPELLYRVFSQVNGFEVVSMMINGKQPGSWYHVKDPEAVKERVTLINDYPTELILVARKTDAGAGLQMTPQQSDYTVLWTGTAGQEVRRSGLAAIYQKTIPKKTRDFIWTLRHFRKNGNLGRYKKGHYMQVD